MKKTNFSFSTLLVAVLISVLASSFFAYKITESTMKQDSPFLVVDFTDLSKRLMVSLREEISLSDVSMNPEMIKLMAQSEARKLFNQVSRYNPDKIVLAKSQIIYNPAALDITSLIADQMGLPEATDEKIQEFINGTSKSNPSSSDVVGRR
jgi:hypothetical protein